MAKRFFGFVIGTVKFVAGLGVIGYAIGAGATAVASAAAGIFVAGFETGVASAKDIHIKDTDVKVEVNNTKEAIENILSDEDEAVEE